MIQHLLHDARQGPPGLHPLGKPLMDEVDGILAPKNIPYAVTCDDDELVVALTLERVDVRCRANHLLMRLQAQVLFIIEVADRSGQVEIAVHAELHHGADLTALHLATRLLDAVPLPRKVRLVVLRERHRPALAGEHRAAVSSIGARDDVGADQADDTCAADPIGVGLQSRAVVVCVPKDFVHPVEGGDEGAAWVLARASSDRHWEMLLAEIRNLLAPVSVHDGEGGGLPPTIAINALEAW
mmetsp:Transcript_49512/g.105883  ORF Transcript_49512/g.105883 Transcript_49512/m.105883 type:complete len:241 (+) Transcript_49512:298-1020(+)